MVKLDSHPVTLMSSNALASSRSRARHQPTSRRRFVEHPRFLKLVQELARLNEIKNAKQQQEDADRANSEATSASLNCSTQVGAVASASRTSGNGSATALNCTSTSYNQSQSTTTSSGNVSTPTNEDRRTSKTSPTHHPISKQPQIVDQNNSMTIEDLLLLNNNNNNNNNNNTNSNITDNNNQIELNSNNNNNQTTNIAQDENRSKRKRSTIDNTNGSRKGSSSDSNSGNGANKKLKSSSDHARPLSPSFTKCPICLLDCMDRDPSFTNTCFHLFCYSCIENWSKNKQTCPLCRTKFTKIIFNIKSAKSFEEKVTIPPRRDDDESFLTDRNFMHEYLGMQSATARNNDPQEVQFIFEHFNRNQEVLMPQFFVNNLDSTTRPGDAIQFNAATSSSNYNPNVPTNLAFTPNYPIPTNYAIALSFQQRIPPTSAMASAYTSNNNLTNSINDPNSRCFHRNSRYIYGSGDVHTRVTRATSSNTNLEPPLITTHHGHQSHLIHHNQDPPHHHHNQSHHTPNHPIQPPHQPQTVNPHAHHHIQNNHHQQPHHHHHHQNIHQAHLAATHQHQQQQHQIQAQHQHTQTSYQSTNLRTTIDIAPRNARVIGVAQSNLQVPQIHPRSFQNGFARHRQANYSVNPTQLEHANNILDNMYRRLPDM